MQVQPCGFPYGNGTIVYELYRLTCAENGLSFFTCSVRNNKPKLWKLLGSYPELSKYLLGIYVTDKANENDDTANLRYVHPSNITRHENAADIIAKSCNVADVYDEGILNDVSIDRVCESFPHSLQNYWATKQQADLPKIFFLSSLLSIQKGSENIPTNIYNYSEVQETLDWKDLNHPQCRFEYKYGLLKIAGPMQATSVIVFTGSTHKFIGESKFVSKLVFNFSIFYALR